MVVTGEMEGRSFFSHRFIQSHITVQESKSRLEITEIR